MNGDHGGWSSGPISGFQDPGCRDHIDINSLRCLKMERPVHSSAVILICNVLELAYIAGAS
jgi:hypothetical protein